MKKNKSSYEAINKERSLKSCMAEGWKIFSLHGKAYFHYMWIPLLLGGCGYAIFSYVACDFYNQSIVPAYLYVSSGAEMELVKMLFMPSATESALLVLSFLAFIAGFLVFKTACFCQIQHYCANNQLPATHVFLDSAPIRASAVKLLLYYIVQLFILCLATLLLVGIAAITSWWMLLLLLPFIVYWTVVAVIGEQFLLLRNMKLKTALLAAVGKGNSWGGYLILLILTGIPLAIISFIALYPNALLQLAYVADSIGMLSNDPSGMPAYMPILYFILTAIGTAAVYLALSIQTWTLAFKTGQYPKS